MPFMEGLRHIKALFGVLNHFKLVAVHKLLYHGIVSHAHNLIDLLLRNLICVDKILKNAARVIHIHIIWYIKPSRQHL